MIKNIFKNIILMLRFGNVTYSGNTIYYKVKCSFILAFILVFFTTILIIFITGTLSSLNTGIPINHIQEKHFNQGFIKHIILTAIVAPIFEELTFRAWLLPLRIYLSVALYCITYLFVTYNYSDSNFYYLFLSFPTVFVFFLYNNSNVFKFIQIFFVKNKLIVLYFSILLFQVFHFFNFDNKLGLLLLVFITIPQLLSGIILSYTMLKYGLPYSMLLHIINNVVFLLINRI